MVIKYIFILHFIPIYNIVTEDASNQSQTLFYRSKQVCASIVKSNEIYLNGWISILNKLRREFVMKHIERYFKNHKIEAEHILSACCSGKNLILSLDSGEEISCTMRMYELMEYLPEEAFVLIRKGILLRKSGILSISDDGVYTMLDGRTFCGRKRSCQPHRKLRAELGLNASAPQTSSDRVQPRTLSLLEKCSILDDMPVAYCVIELVFDESGCGVDFIFRYCNHYMAVVEGVPVEAMVDHSFYEVFKNGDRKWLVAYADVALNGRQRTLHDYSPEINKTLTIHCYQPEPGYCACVLEEDRQAPADGSH